MQEAVLTFIAQKCMQTKDLEEQKRIFQELDENGEGSITRDDLVRGYQKWYGGSRVFAMKEADDIMACADLDGNGELSYTNWLIATANRSQAIDEAKLRVAFDFFDKDGLGAITRQNMEASMKDMQGVEEATWDEIIAEVDEDGDGKINFKEFTKMMMRLVDPNAK